MDSAADIPVLKESQKPVTLHGDVDAAAREVYQHNLNSIVKVSTTSTDGSSATGSGVLVKEGNDVVIVTNAHVGDATQSVSFSNAAGENFSATVEKYDDTNDLAVLKPEGVKLNPALAVEIGDPTKLTPGQMLYAMGNPRGYTVPVLSQGTFKQVGSFNGLAPDTCFLIRQATRALYKGDKDYVKDAEQFCLSPRISATLPSDHGNSGGAELDKNSKLVGIVESFGDKPGESIAVSSAKVQALLDDPHYKFQFDYKRQTLADLSPVTAAVKGIGLVGLAASPASQKIAGPLIGLYYGAEALSNLRILSHDGLYQSRSHYWGEVAADGAAFAAGILTLVPRYRLAGACILAARLAVDTIDDFTATKPVLDQVERRDGRKGEPLLWSASHRQN